MSLMLRHANSPVKSFSLLELIAVVSIVALLVGVLVYYIPSYASWTQSTVDSHSIQSLNKALEAYKLYGGMTMSHSLVGRNTSAKISAVIAALKTGFTSQGMGFHFLDPSHNVAITGLTATGSGASFTFGSANPYPFGLGVCFMANGGAPYYITVNSTSGYVAVNNTTNTVVYSSGGLNIPATPAITFWASDASGNPGGNITTILAAYSSGLTSLDVSGCTSLQTLYCQQNPGLTKLNVSGLTSLQTVYCYQSSFSSINASNCPSLTALKAYANATGCAINITGDTALSTFTYDASAVITGP